MSKSASKSKHVASIPSRICDVERDNLIRKGESAAETVGEETADVGAHVVEEVPAFQELDKLQSMGIAAADISKLKSGGCHTVC